MFVEKQDCVNLTIVVSCCNLGHLGHRAPLARLARRLVYHLDQDCKIAGNLARPKWGKIARLLGNLAQILVLLSRHTAILVVAVVVVVAVDALLRCRSRCRSRRSSLVEVVVVVVVLVVPVVAVACCSRVQTLGHRVSTKVD